MCEVEGKFTLIGEKDRAREQQYGGKETEGGQG
jgi:hypothetical protein